LIGRGFKVTGIDISSEMIRLACGFCPEAIFELMDMQHIKFAGRSFDALISTYSLMHVPSYNLAATINGFARVLKPSGYMFLAFLNGEQKDYFFDEPFNPTKKDFMNLTPLPKVTELVKKIPMSIISTSEINLPKPEFGCQTAGYIIAKKSDEI
jgi:ubiquinone/menaquinone biosynthesis C-methylase UbiE